MPTNLEAAIIKFDGLALRLRIMITLSILALLYMLFDLFWFSFNDQAIKKAQQEITMTTKQNAELISMQEDFNLNIVKKRNNPKKIKLEMIGGQLSDIRNQLKQKTANLVQPEDMADVIKTIITSTKSLKIQRISKQKTIELSSEFTEVSNNKDEKDSAPIKLYRHSMEILLKGNYTSTHQFLDKLEKMKKQVAFDAFEYIVKDYPQAEIKLIVSTLSLQKEWVGG